MDYYTALFWAEIFVERKDGSQFKLEKGFNTLEEAKTWIKAKMCKSSSNWCIESGGELILKGE